MTPGRRNRPTTIRVGHLRKRTIQLSSFLVPFFFVCPSLLWDAQSERKREWERIGTANKR
jgi:hypothetical protein